MQPANHTLYHHNLLHLRQYQSRIFALLGQLHPDLIQPSPIPEHGTGDATAIVPLPSITDDYKQTSHDRPPGTPEHISVIFGLGLGKWLTQYHKSHFEDLHRMAIIEPDIHQVYRLLDQIDLQYLCKDNHVFWIIGNDISYLSRLLGEASVNIGSWGLSFYINESTEKLNPEIYANAEERVKNSVQLARQNTQVQVQRGLFIQHNILRNLPSMIRSISLNRLQDSLPGTPAVIIGAGPSLDKNVDLLKNARQGYYWLQWIPL